MSLRYFQNKTAHALQSKRVRAGLIGFALVFGAFYMVALKPPSNFPVGSVIEVEEGQSLSEIAHTLEERKVVSSAKWLRNFVILLRGEKGVFAGSYYLPEKKTALGIAYALSRGEFGVDTIPVLIPEGAASYEIASILSRELSNFNRGAFLKTAEGREGKLFPDTYFFLPATSHQVVLKAFQKNFKEKEELLRQEVERAGYDFEEALIMASLLEKEARKMETRQIIAGILWKRLELGMPLQVDAVFGYIEKRATFHPTFETLKVESPYNTYTNVGLPPGPIGNPGEDAIYAAITPIETPYLYYLTDRNGVMRYAETFEGHKRNRALYLD
ncbi:MAG: endolytic transglycosylase MltG [Candidatus Paceibacterota bacterium]